MFRKGEGRDQEGSPNEGGRKRKKMKLVFVVCAFIVMFCYVSAMEINLTFVACALLQYMLCFRDDKLT